MAAGSDPAAVGVAGEAGWALWAEVASAVGAAETARWAAEGVGVQEAPVEARRLRQR